MAGTFSAFMPCGPGAAILPMGTPKGGIGRKEARVVGRTWAMSVRAMICGSVVTDIGTPQIDGRVWVTERHTFADGTTQDLMTLVASGFDAAAMVMARAQAMNTDIARLNDADAIVPVSIPVTTGL